MNKALNVIYEGAVVSAISIGYAVLGSKIWKTQTIKFDYNHYLYVMGYTACAINTKNFLVSKGILPVSIFG